MIYLGNAFSLQMVSFPTVIQAVEVEPSEIPAEAISCIGHSDTAAVVSDFLGRSVPNNRVNVHLAEGDILYVAQLSGGRLPEGSTHLPDGFEMKFVRVTVSAA